MPAGADGVSELLADVEILSEILDGRLFVHVELVELVVGEAFLTQVELVDKELPREALCVFLDHERSGLGDYVGLRHLRSWTSASLETIFMAEVAMRV